MSGTLGGHDWVLCGTIHGEIANWENITIINSDNGNNRDEADLRRKIPEKGTRSDAIEQIFEPGFVFSDCIFKLYDFGLQLARLLFQIPFSGFHARPDITCPGATERVHLF